MRHLRIAMILLVLLPATGCALDLSPHDPARSGPEVANIANYAATLPVLARPLPRTLPVAELFPAS